MDPTDSNLDPQHCFKCRILQEKYHIKIIFWNPVLQNRTVYPGSWLRIFLSQIQGRTVPGFGSATKNLSIFQCLDPDPKNFLPSSVLF